MGGSFRDFRGRTPQGPGQPQFADHHGGSWRQGWKVANKYPYWEVVREQQRSVNIQGVVKIEANGYEREDGIHFTTKSQLAFGAALAGLLPAP